MAHDVTNAAEPTPAQHWALWGKAQPPEGGRVPCHPLLYHMLDVACVARELLDTVLPRCTVRRLTDPLGIDSGAAIRWLVLVVALHDLGKTTPPFQIKAPEQAERLRQLGFDLDPPQGSADHGTIGVHLSAAALTSFGLDDEFAWSLARATCSHHGTFVLDADSDPSTFGRRQLGASPHWLQARSEIIGELARWTEVTTLPKPRSVVRDWAFYSALAGLVTTADWVGSMAEVFEYELPGRSTRAYTQMATQRAGFCLDRIGFAAPFAASAASFKELFGVDPWPLHDAVQSVTQGVAPPYCMIVEAPMGEGKTEAAFFVAHANAASGAHDGTYIGLPTQATANQMFNRLRAFVERTRPDQRTNLQLLHGEAVFDTRVRDLLRAVYSPDSVVVSEGWFLQKKRSLLAPFGAGTIDQALFAVLRTKHAFVRQFGLAGKTVVLDEVHAYDTYTSTLLDRLLSWLGALGTTVVLLSATLPRTRRQQLLRAYLSARPNASDEPGVTSGSDVPYPRLTVANGQSCEVLPVRSRRTQTIGLQWELDDAPSALRRASEQLVLGGCVGWICNSVRRAQDAFRCAELARDRGSLPADTVVLLLHARFPQEERLWREEQLIERLGRNGTRPARMLVIGTQVLEQSLDVDFDLLITDLAPIDLVLQRAGRLHRHSRPRPEGAEVPQLVIARPRGTVEDAQLDTVSAVYEPYVVRRSLMALLTCSTLQLPEQIEPLIDVVYEAPLPSDSHEVFRKERADYERRCDDMAARAKTRTWPWPSLRDDPFGDLLTPYEEDNPEVAEQLRAATRLGGPSVEAVCLFGTPERAFLDRIRQEPINLACPPTIDHVRRLAQRTVRIAHPALVHSLNQTAPPKSWQSSATLSRRRALFFGAQPIAIAGFKVDLDPQLGLTIIKEGSSDGELSAD